MPASVALLLAMLCFIAFQVAPHVEQWLEERDR